MHYQRGGIYLHGISKIDALWRVPSGFLDLYLLEKDSPHESEKSAQFFSRHPDLADKLCRLVNIYYQTPHPVQTVQNVIGRIGMPQTRNLLACIIILSETRIQSDHLGWLSAMRNQSILCAVLGAFIAQLIEPDLTDQAFVVGLLCNFGAIVHLQTNPGSYANLRNFNPGDAGYVSSVIHRGQADGAASCVHLLREWHFNEDIVNAVFGSNSTKETLLATIIRKCSAVVNTNMAYPEPIVGGALSVDDRFGFSQMLLHLAQERADTIAAVFIGQSSCCPQNGQGARAMVTTGHDPLGTRQQSSAELSVRKNHHEMRNALTIIKNYLKIVTTRLSGGIPVHAETAIIESEVDRLARLLDDTGSGLETPEITVCDINAIVTHCATLMGTIPPGIAPITIRTSLHPALLLVSGSSDALSQVLINLIKNAAEAMPEGGQISVSTRLAGSMHGRDTTYIQSDIVEICIQDSGPGIAAHLQPFLFEPHQSAKAVGHSGLGLHIVRDIIVSFGGTIRYEAPSEGGSLFRIALSLQKPSSHQEDLFAYTANTHR
jgi:signal transduction histidine kinase/HD-like signal output (HDOD) protein